MDRRLTIKEEEVQTDGKTRHLGNILSEDHAVRRRRMNLGED
jgi:hypothetical protein